MCGTGLLWNKLPGPASVWLYSDCPCSRLAMRTLAINFNNSSRLPDVDLESAAALETIEV
jgi:hypothetical protein